MGIIRPMDDKAIEALLQQAVIVRIACCVHQPGSRPYLVPMPCFYADGSLYGYSGPGTKIRIMRENPLVTVEVDSGTASDQWQSVIAEGVSEELVDPAEQTDALALIARQSGETPVADKESVVFRIRLEARSGRYEMPD